MKIIDILVDSANLLGLSREMEILCATTEENVEETMKNSNISTMFRLVKFSIQELCTNYVPVATTQNFVTNNKMYPVSNLKNYIKVQKVCKNDDVVNFKIISRNIVMAEDGEYTVQYTTYPEIENIFEDVDFAVDFGVDAIILGLCSYFALAKGMYNEFETFHDQYLDKANSIKSLRIFDLPKRRWE